MDTNDLERMGRRRFIDTLAGIGVGSTTLKYLDQDELSDITYDPEEEVPYVSMLEFDADGQTPVYDTIDAEKYERIGATLEAREQLQREYELEDFSISIKGEDQSPIDFGLEVRVPEGQEVIEERLPTEISGSSPQGESFDYIPVESEEIDLNGPQSSSSQQPLCYNHIPEWQYGVPGGALIEAVGNGGQRATITAPFNHDNYGEGWIMSGHVAEDGGEEIRLRILGGNTFPLGEVREKVKDVRSSSIPGRGIYAIDFAFVEKTGDYEPNPSISAPGNSDYDLNIRALLTDENIRNHVGDESWEVQRQGAATCRQSSHITSYDPEGYAKLENPGQVGDSGGPVFKEYSNDKAALGGVYVGEDAGILDKDGIFTTVEEIEERLDGNFYG